MEEDPRRRSRSKVGRRLRSLLALAAEYLKYLFMNRRRLVCRVARRTLAVLSSYHGKSKKHPAPYWPPPALAGHEFSFSASPSPTMFPAARKLRSRLKRGAAARASGSSCSLGASYQSYGSPEATAEEEVMEEEEEDEACYGLELDVDYRAEEFINMFYEQLRAQNYAPVNFCSIRCDA